MRPSFRYRRSRLALPLCLAALAAGPARGAQVVATWNPGTASWGTAGNWTPNVVPNNGADTYLVVIDGEMGTGSIVALDIDATIDGLTIGTDDTLEHGNDRDLTIATDAATIDGTWSLNSTNQDTFIRFIVETNVSGTGEIVLGDNSNNRLLADGVWVHLPAGFTLRGAGQILANTGGLNNGGTIKAQGANALTIDPAALGFANHGVMRAEGAGGLTLTAGVFINTGGDILAGNGSVVRIASLASIVDGTIGAEPGGEVQFVGDAGNAPTIIGTTLSGALGMPVGQDLVGRGTLANNGTLTLVHSGGGESFFRLEQAATLGGSGEVVFTGANGQRIITDNTIATHGADHTIRGANAAILENTGGMKNLGTIRQEGSGSLGVDPNELGFENGNILESAGPGTLSLINGTFANADGTIRALDGGKVQIGPAATVSGGVATTEGTGTISIAGDGGSAPVLDGVHLQGSVVQSIGQDAVLRGTVRNDAAWQTQHTGGGENFIRLELGATLTGEGDIELAGTNAEFITTDGSTFTQEVDHTIRGGGSLLADTGGMLNKGTVLQQGAEGLGIDPAAERSFDNDGTVRAEGSGGIGLSGGLFLNDGHTMTAADGSSITLGSQARVEGGTLATEDSGEIRMGADGLNAPVMEDVTLTGLTRFPASMDAFAEGTLTNDGTMRMEHSGGGENFLQFRAGASLAGTGELVFQGGNSQIVNTDGTTMTHGADHTIRGKGAFILNNTGGMVNHGTIRQEGATGSISVDPSDAGFANDGFLESSGAGSLILANGAYDNEGGTIRALDGGVVQLGPSASFENGVATTEGTGVLRFAGDQGAAPQLKDIHLSGSIVQAASQDVVLSGTIENDATWQMQHAGGGENFVRLDQSATLTGDGEIEMAGANSEYITTDGSTFTHGAGHTIRGGGNILFDTGGMLNLGSVLQQGAEGLGINPSAARSFDNDGTLRAEGAGGLHLSGGLFLNDGHETTAADGSFVSIGPSATFQGGTLETEGNGDIRMAGDGGNAPVLKDVTLAGLTRLPVSQDAYAEGIIVNNGTVRMEHVGGGENFLQFRGGATLSGTGEILFQGGNAQFVTTDDTTMVHAATHRIRGGNANLLNNAGGMANHGTIEQEGAGAITINPGAPGLTNDGTMKSSGAGGLHLTDGAFDNTNGLVEATTGGRVAIGPSANVQHGTLRGTGTGVIDFVGDGGNRSTIGDTTLEGNIRNDVSQDVQISSDIVNNGTWTTQHVGGGEVNILVLDGAEIGGTGEIHLAGAGFESITTNNTTFVHGAGHTIRSGGNILAGSGGMLNKGTILGDAGDALVIQPNGLGVRNEGTIAATTAAGISIQGGTHFNGPGGRLFAADGGRIDIGPGSFVDRMFVESEGTGSLTISGDGGNRPTLKNARLQGAISQGISQDVRLLGLVQHDSLWTLSHVGGGESDIRLDDGAFLAGAGDVHFSQQGSNILSTNNTVGSHAAGHVLRGRGFILANTGGLRNYGSFVADDAGTMFIDANALGFVNYGTVRANAGSILQLSDAANFENRGAIEVPAGGTVLVPSGTLTQTAGTIAMGGGTLNLTQGGGGQMLDVQGGVLEGTGTIWGALVRSAGETRVGAPVGQLDIGSGFAQLAGGVLDVTLAGTVSGAEYDVLAVTGSIDMAGRLNVERGPLHAISPGQSYTVATWTGTRTGTFDPITGLAQPGGVLLEPAYNANDLTLTAAFVPGFYVEDAIVEETDDGTISATIRVNLFPAPTQAASVTLTFSDKGATAGVDYIQPGEIAMNFGPGFTQQTTTVQIVGDAVPEPEEFVLMNLVSPSGAPIARIASTIVIRDNDGNDCDESGVSDAFEIAEGILADLNGNGVPDSCDIESLASYDCNDNGIPDEVETDCNANGIADECDIADGYSTDNNGDDVPDECGPEAWVIR